MTEEASGPESPSARGRRVLVTGASRGIGRAIAVAFAGGGWRVALLARESADLEEAAAACRSHTRHVLVGHADVRDASAIGNAVSAMEVEWGGLDVLVNNAGTGRYGPFLELDVEAWTEMLEVNIVGVVNVTRAVLPGMLRQGRGHIINMGSIRGLEAASGTTGYAASKFALVGLTEALHDELTHAGVTVSLVSPGGVRTDFAGVPAAEKRSPFLDPEVVAEVVVSIAEMGERAWIREMTVLPRNYDRHQAPFTNR